MPHAIFGCLFRHYVHYLPLSDACPLLIATRRHAVAITLTATPMIAIAITPCLITRHYCHAAIIMKRLLSPRH